jgi:2,3-bisphosphoglycerate-independent phosphoglycerate mutase
MRQKGLRGERGMSGKFLFLVADGMGGWPLAELGGRTVLEAAATPAMDALARQGLTGLARTIPPGMPPGSDVANMSLLGFDPKAHHTGRGPIEAAAKGLKLSQDDLVWRCNLVRVSEYGPEGLMLDYCSGHMRTEQAAPLVAKLQERCAGHNGQFEFHVGVQYRHLLVQRGAAQAPEAKAVVRPPHDISGQSIARDLELLADYPQLSHLAACAARVLAEPDNPTLANAIWPWGQGQTLTLPDFGSMHGLKGAVISAVDLIKGLGQAAGMSVLDVPGATGLLDTNYAGKVEAAKTFLRHGDFVFVHLEGPDECGHGGDVPGKIEAVARFDRLVVKPLREAFPEAAVLVTCDHLTPIAKRTHVEEPVPFAFWRPGLEHNGAQAFSEAQAKASGLMKDPGHRLLAWALEKGL